MGARATTKSFVTEVELLPTGRQAKKLRAKFEATRQVYNAALGEARRRLRLMRESRAWQAARKMPKGKDRSQAFRKAQERFAFREYDLHAWGKQFTGSWINAHIGARTVEACISLAFKTVEEHLYKTDHKRLKFRRRGDLRSVEGKKNSCCRWKGDRIEWRGLVVHADIDSTDEVQRHGLQAKVKYVRMVRRVIRDTERYFAQLVCEGEPFRKPDHKPGEGIVGLDIGTQTIAIVGERSARLKCFCPELQRDKRMVRRLQRALDRSRRSTNPDQFTADGGIKRLNPGERRCWNQSRNYLRLRSRLSNYLRREADYRRNLHGRLVAEVLTFGNRVQMEKLSYQAWAKRSRPDGNRRRKRYGKSIGRRAPGMFVSRLKLEAEKWGAQVDEFETRTTRLSQTCHCGVRQRKSLNQRTHKCSKCGAFAQRDLYSAFLARFVEGGRLHADRAEKAWSGTCAALGAAWSDIKQANGLPASLGLRARDRAACSRNGLQNDGENADAVSGGKPPRESRAELSETDQNIVSSTLSWDRTVYPNTDCGDSGADSG